MPALISHYLCGDKMIDSIIEEGLKEKLLYNRQVFNLGTQGPDILFNASIWPAKSHSDISAIGKRMHSKKTGSIMKSFMHYINGCEPMTKNMLSSYFYGYLAHYSLDSHAHPYVYYRAGFNIKGHKISKEYSCYHRMLEKSIDFLMAKHIMGKRPVEMKSYELIKIEDAEAKEIGKLYAYALKEVYGIDIKAEQISGTITNMETMERIVADRTGLKKKILGTIEVKIKGYPAVSSKIYPLELKDDKDIDYLNLQYKKWCFPWDKALINQSSFLDMFEEAVSEAKVMCKAAADFLMDKIAIEDAARIIGNRSFYSGLDSDKKIEFKYFDSIYERE